MPKKIIEIRYAELLEDVSISGVSTILRKGTQLDVAKSNSRYVYLLWNKCLLRIARSKVKAIRKRR